MLKTNIKLWAIVVAVCLIGQFFIAAVPGWIEQGKQEAQIEIAKREEERLQSSHEPGLAPIEKTPVETEPVVESGSIAVEKTNENAEVKAEEEEFTLPIGFIILAIVVIFATIFILFV